MASDIQKSFEKGQVEEFARDKAWVYDIELLDEMLGTAWEWFKHLVHMDDLVGPHEFASELAHSQISKALQSRP